MTHAEAAQLVSLAPWLLFLGPLAGGAIVYLIRPPWWLIVAILVAIVTAVEVL